MFLIIEKSEVTTDEFSEYSVYFQKWEHKKLQICWMIQAMKNLNLQQNNDIL